MSSSMSDYTYVSESSFGSTSLGSSSSDSYSSGSDSESRSSDSYGTSSSGSGSSSETSSSSPVASVARDARGSRDKKSGGGSDAPTKSDLYLTDDEIREKYSVPRKRMKNYRRVFDQYDRDGDGVIDARELKSMLEMLSADHSAADVQLMLEEADMDADNLINFSEFVQMMIATQKTHLCELYEAFKVFDDDNSGFVDEGELGKVMEHLGKRMDGAQLRKMLAAADTDHDGKVSFAEFARILNYDGDMYTMEQLEAETAKQRRRALASEQYGTDSDGSNAGALGVPGMSDDDSSSSSSIEPGYIKVNVHAFYLGQRYRFHISRNARLKSLCQRLARMTGYGVTFHRFFYEGFPLDIIKQGGRTLAELNIDGSRPLFFIYLRGKFTVSHSDCFDEDGLPILPVLYDVFRKEEVMPRADALALVDRARAIMRHEPNMLELWEPMTVVGDLHGQFYDLPEVFKAGGRITGKHNYLFLGDYVDRGYFSCEVILYLLAAKVRYPDKVFLLRGNHESRKTTSKYGTLEEVSNKYSKKLYHKLMACFDAMPLYALVHTGNHRILMMHGGLSHHIETLDQIESINRFSEPPKRGPLKDCLWTDPYEDNQVDNMDSLPKVWDLSKLKRRKERAPKTFTSDFFHECDRGTTLKSFGQPAVSCFLHRNNLLSIFRAHEQKMSGMELYRYGPEYRFPGLVTIFSAPNYTDHSMNQGCVVTIRNGIIKFKQYRWRLHPQYIPPAHSPPGHMTKDLDAEAFIQYVNWLHPRALRELPLYQLMQEFHDMFVLDGKKPSSGGGEQAWALLDDNLMAVLQLSKDPLIRSRYRRKTKAMLLWLRGFTFFDAALEAEAPYERDPDDDIKTAKKKRRRKVSSLFCF